jgi:two-component system, NarL family, invasion response regulator UvrY
MIRTLVVDDHPLVRRGILHMLSETKDIVCKDEAGSGTDALLLVQKSDYDIVVLDIRLPDNSGLEILKQIRSSKPELPVLMLSVYSEKQYATRALKAGASGYLTKDTIPEELVNAIYKIARGERYVSPTLGKILAAEASANSDGHQALSDREYQVMCMLASGKAASQIAKELSLSVKTVSTYRTRLLDKLKLETTSQLIHYAIENNLCE